MKAAATCVAALFLLLTLSSVLTTAPAPEPDPMHWLAEQDASGIHVIEAVIATGGDPADWDGRNLYLEVEVPDDPISFPRVAYTFSPASRTDWARPGLDPNSIPIRLIESVPDLVNETNDAVVSWSYLAMTRWTMVHGTEPVFERILELQRPDGSWQCDGVPGPECTAFAVAALGTPSCCIDALERARAYLESRYSPGQGYLDPRLPPNAQTTAWTIHALRQLGAEVPQDAYDFLASQQLPNGAYLAGGKPSVWATAEVVTLMEAGHPL